MIPDFSSSIAAMIPAVVASFFRSAITGATASPESGEVGGAGGHDLPAVVAEPCGRCGVVSERPDRPVAGRLGRLGEGVELTVRHLRPGGIADHDDVGLGEEGDVARSLRPGGLVVLGLRDRVAVLLEHRCGAEGAEHVPGRGGVRRPDRRAVVVVGPQRCGLGAERVPQGLGQHRQPGHPGLGEPLHHGGRLVAGHDLVEQLGGVDQERRVDGSHRVHADEVPGPRRHQAEVGVAGLDELDRRLLVLRGLEAAARW